MSAVPGAPPLIELKSVVKNYGADTPLRIRQLRVDASDRVVLSGLGVQAAEMLMHLICGALLPDEGEVQVEGTSTADIRTDQQWLRSLDRFGLVTSRSVLIDSLPAIANLALPLTLSIDPMAETTRVEAESIGRLVSLPADRLSAPVATLTPAERLRLHLGRALIQRPQLVLLEHPTRELEGDDARADFGRTLASAAAGRRAGWLAVSDDGVFARAAGGTRMAVKPATGDVSPPRAWWKIR